MAACYVKFVSAVGSHGSGAAWLVKMTIFITNNLGRRKISTKRTEPFIFVNKPQNRTEVDRSSTLQKFGLLPIVTRCFLFVLFKKRAGVLIQDCELFERLQISDIDQLILALIFRFEAILV